jgi:hypothetical protein
MKTIIKNILFVSSLVFSACGMKEAPRAVAHSSARVADSTYGMADMALVNYSTQAVDSTYRATEEVNYISDSSRKFVITASLTLRVGDLENSELKLNEIMNKYNAYTTETSINANTLRYTIKIAADGYRQFFEEMKAIGKIEHHNENLEDVTLYYYDIEGRLATQRELMQTYRGYLGRAENIGEIMTVERRIAELQYEIDKTGEEFTKLNNSIDFSTIRLTLNGPRNDEVYYTETIKDKIQALFKGFGGYVSTVMTILVGLIIYGIPSLIILLLLYLVLLGRIGILKKIWRLLNDKKVKR